MAAVAQHAYLMLADISGYTSYLAGVELDHAHEILADLLETIVNPIKALFTIAKLEGDCVFAYAQKHILPCGETLFELIESIYVAFSDRRETVRRRTTCTCSACRAIPSLDLKFIVHHGDFIIQTIAHSQELIGTAVNLAHRLMKNGITDATGWQAYALFTEQALEHLAVRPEGMHAQVETYEHLGDVSTHSLNLRQRYEEIVAARRVNISTQEADYVLVQDFPAAPPVVWEWLTDVADRNIWMQSTGVKWMGGARIGGRTGPGARNHCAHGKQLSKESIETILDWRPFSYFSTESVNGRMVMRETMQLEPLAAGGTRLHDRICINNPLPRPLRRLFVKFVFNVMMKYPALFANSARLLTEDLTRREAQASELASDA